MTNFRPQVINNDVIWHKTCTDLVWLICAMKNNKKTWRLLSWSSIFLFCVVESWRCWLFLYWYGIPITYKAIFSVEYFLFKNNNENIIFLFSIILPEMVSQIISIPIRPIETFALFLFQSGSEGRLVWQLSRNVIENRKR